MVKNGDLPCGIILEDDKKNKTVLELLVEFMELLIAFIGQQTRHTIERSVSGPLKDTGQKVAIAVASGFIFGIASIFIAVGLFQLLAELVGSTWLVFLIIGFLLTVVGIIIIRVGGRDG